MNIERRRGTGYSALTRAFTIGASELVRDLRELVMLTLCIMCVVTMIYMVVDPLGFTESVARVAAWIVSL